MKKYDISLWNTPDSIKVIMESSNNGNELTIHLPEFDWRYTYNFNEIKEVEVQKDLESIFSHKEDRDEIVAHFFDYINKERIE